MIKNLSLGVLCLALFLAGCTGGSGVPMKDYESANLGIALKMPESWVAEEVTGALYLASSQEALENQELTDQAAVSISTSTTVDFNNTEDPVAIVSEFMSRFNTVGEGLEITQEATKTTIQGQPAAQTTFRGVIANQTGTFTLVAIVKGSDVIVIFSVDGSTDNQFAAIIDSITNSVRFK